MYYKNVWNDWQTPWNCNCYWIKVQIEPYSSESMKSWTNFISQNTLNWGNFKFVDHNVWSMFD
jgi:hypothetical protein